MFGKMFIALLLLVLVGCANSFHRVDNISFPVSDTHLSPKSSVSNVLVEDIRDNKDIPTFGLYNVLHDISPTPAISVLLETKLVEKLDRMPIGDFVKVQIRDCAFEAYNALVKGSARLVLTVEAEVYRSGRSQRRTFVARKAEIDIPAGFRGIPYEDIAKRFLLEAIEDVSRDVLKLYETGV